MMRKKKMEYIHILCTSRSYLAPLKLMGPVVHPLKVSKNAAYQLLLSGAEVIEYIPETKMTLKLTLMNINDPNRYDALKTEAPKAAAPVVQKENAGIHPVNPVPKKEEPKPVPAAEVKAPVVETVPETTSEPEAKEDPKPESNPEPVKEPETENTETVSTVPEVSEDVPNDDVSKIDSYELKIGDNGKVIEEGIDWSSFTKAERRALRARINAINEAAN